ncbi:hypothetical protein PSDVSF_27900 [Pseudodesulfovibrio sediminis]|uniref:Uncharacterized protein n=2 Tax=Pseudodesulfovibrio sediminis TaxID=2810563 RepID=A0ABM7P9B7_9BACT|nr:hypothetical protein PSDVSF_27900 [Pseudodesulfovibrio sediminis]
MDETKYIGEVGLDGSKEFKDHLPEQEIVFSRILELCEQSEGKVLSVHSRGATQKVLDLIEQHPYCGHVVLHWFTGSKKDAKRAIDLGCWFSVNAAMLQSQRAKSVFETIPKDHIVTESDGPFILDKDKPSSPLSIGNTVQLIADIWQTNLPTTDSIIIENLNAILDI